MFAIRLTVLLTCFTLFCLNSTPGFSQTPAGKKSSTKSSQKDDGGEDPKDGNYNLKVKTTDIFLGKTVSGPQEKREDLKDKVIFLEYWGIHCPPCIASLPHVSALNRELADFGLVTIGSHAQEGTDAEIRQMAESKGVSYTITTGTRVNGANDFSTIPHSIVFDHTGACIYRGYPDGAYPIVRAAVGKAIVAKTGKSTFSKPVQTQADSLIKGAPPLSVLPKLVALSRGSNEIATEAKSLVDAIVSEAQKKLTTAEDLAKDSPLAAFLQVEPLSTSFKGTSVATKANGLIVSLKKEKVVANELSARPGLEMIKKLDMQLVAAAAGVDLKNTEFQKAMATQLKQLKQKAAVLKKNYPDSKANEEVVRILTKYGL